jgi:hypothetical protein
MAMARTANPLGKRRPFDEFHGDGADSAFVREAVHLGDMRVIESSKRLCLAVEARQAFRVECEIGG